MAFITYSLDFIQWFEPEFLHRDRDDVALDEPAVRMLHEPREGAVWRLWLDDAWDSSTNQFQIAKCVFFFGRVIRRHVYSRERERRARTCGADVFA